MLAILGAVLVVLLAVFAVVGVCDPAWVHGFFFGVPEGTEKFRILEFVGVGMGGVLLAIGAAIANRRAAAMEETAKQQATANEGAEDGRRQERLKNAIEHLGHESDSVRLGGAYELFHLARDTGGLRQTAMDILCAHIRRTTGESEYRETHEAKPSTEVQSLLTLLFTQEHEVFTGRRIDLRGSWLNGAMLKRARLQGADLFEARLQGANLLGAQLQGADLYGARLQKADLSEARLQKADLSEARLQEAILSKARLQGARLSEAQLQGAFLPGAQLQEAILSRARLQGAILSEAQLQGAHLLWARLQSASLYKAQLQGTSLRGAQLQGADLLRAELQGATCQDFSFLSFEERIREGTGRESDLSKATFADGLRRENVDSLVEGVPDEGAGELRQELEPHLDRPPSHELPEDSGAIVGTYTEEEAERWIAEYREAMRGVPKADG